MLASVSVEQSLPGQECSAGTAEEGACFGNLTAFCTDLGFLHHIRTEAELFQIPEPAFLHHSALSSPSYTSL